MLFLDFSLRLMLWQIFVLAYLFLLGYCLYDVFKSNYNNRLGYILLLLFFPVGGVIIYYLIKKKAKI